MSELNEEKINRIKKEAVFLFDKYPDHILIILHTKHKNTVKLDKIKYLVNKSMKFDEFINTLQFKLKIEKNHVLYFKINDQIIKDTSQTIQQLQSNVQEGFLIIEICRYTKYIRKAISLLTMNML